MKGWPDTCIGLIVDPRIQLAQMHRAVEKFEPSRRAAFFAEFRRMHKSTELYEKSLVCGFPVIQMADAYVRLGKRYGIDMSGRQHRSGTVGSE